MGEMSQAAATAASTTSTTTTVTTTVKSTAAKLEALGIAAPTSSENEPFNIQAFKSVASTALQSSESESAVIVSHESKIVNILFGSVNGNAMEIARRIYNELEHHGFQKGCLATLNDYALAGLVKEPQSKMHPLIIVCSTTGDGDLPENALKIFKFLRVPKPAVGVSADSAEHDKEKFLKGYLDYTILGLGDTNYENFCNAAKRIDKAVHDAGGKKFYKRGEADDGTGLEQVVEPWIDKLWPKLAELFEKRVHGDGNGAKDGAAAVTAAVAVAATAAGVDATVLTLQTTSKTTAETTTITETTISVVEGIPAPLEIMCTLNSLDKSVVETPCYPMAIRDQKIYTSKVSDAKLMTSEDMHDRRVWHIELDCSDFPIEYMPGDTLGVVVENRLEDVSHVLERISYPADGMNESTIVQLLRKDTSQVLAQAASIRTLLTRLVDLNQIPKKTLLVSLAEACSNEEEKKQLLFLSSRPGRDQYAEKMKQGNWTFLKLLDEYPSCRPSILLLVDQLPPLAVRYYSASSAQEMDGRKFHAAFSVVNLENNKRGLATGMLEDKCKQYLETKSDSISVEIVLQPHTQFKPPMDLDVPYIMIGPGTGVAPFRGFLRQRSVLVSKHKKSDNDSALGKTWLFFGCRYEKKDFLYETELKNFVRDRVLTELTVAFSRDTEKKVYVNDKLLENKAELAKLLMSNSSSKIYLCGDGGNMAASVDKALTEIIQSHPKDENAPEPVYPTEDEAKSILKAWMKEGRYLKDVWYWG